MLSNGTSIHVRTNGTWSAETDGTLTSRAAAALDQLEGFSVATEYEADVEHVAFLTRVRTEAAGTFTLKLAELPKNNGRDAYARHVTFRELAGIANELALEEPPQTSEKGIPAVIADRFCIYGRPDNGFDALRDHDPRYVQ